MKKKIKNIKLRQNEIDSIKHECKKVWTIILHSPLTYIFISAFGIAWSYYGSFKEATGTSAIWALEYFMLEAYKAKRGEK